jgi:hypothetical protein
MLLFIEYNSRQGKYVMHSKSPAGYPVGKKARESLFSDIQLFKTKIL